MNAKETMLKKYEVIKKIMDSNKVDETNKAYYVEMFVKHWFNEEQIEWIWN